jgi:hypothetical protein
MLAQTTPASVPTIEVEGATIAFYPHTAHGYVVRAIDLTRAIFIHRSDSYRRKFGDFGAVLFRGTGLPKSHPAEPDPWCVSLADARKVLKHLADTPGVRIDWANRAQLILLTMQMMPCLGASEPKPATPEMPAPNRSAPSAADLMADCLSIARRIHAAPAPIRILALELIEMRSPADAELIRAHIRRQRFSFAGVRELIGSAFGRGAGVIS